MDDHKEPRVTEQATALAAAVRKLVKAKGRFHTEQNYAALVAALDAYDVAAITRQAAPEAPTQQANAPAKLTRSMCGTKDYCQGWNDCVDEFNRLATPAATTASANQPKLFCSVCGVVEGGYHQGECMYIGVVTQAECRAPAPSQEAQAAHAGAVEKDAARWRFSMEFQGDGSSKEQPEAIINMWRKVYAEHRLRPTRAEYEAAIDAAIATSEQKGPQA